MYKVIKLFTDLKDGGHQYNIGDLFPRKGSNVSEERIKELLSSANRQGTPLIEEIKEPKKVVEEKVEQPEEPKEEVVEEAFEEKVEEVVEQPKRKPRKK